MISSSGTGGSAATAPLGVTLLSDVKLGDASDGVLDEGLALTGVTWVGPEDVVPFFPSKEDRDGVELLADLTGAAAAAAASGTKMWEWCRLG